jgi:hypothetical protein
VTRKHGVTDEDVRRDEENDERNYRRLRDAERDGGCCLLGLIAGAGGFALVLAVPMMAMEWGR